MIDPLLISTIRVGQLVEAPFTGTGNVVHEVGTDLRRGSINDFATFLSGIIGASSGFAFLPISVTNSQTLPSTTANEWFLAGKGTYSQTGGYPDIVCTEELNVIIGNGAFWSLGVEIPIVVDPPASMISQTVTENVTNYSPSEDAVFEAIKQAKIDIANILSIQSIDFPRLLAPQQNFNIPTGKTAKWALVNGTYYVLETANNTAEFNTFTQSGIQVTFKNTLEIGEYPVIFYQ